MVAIATLQGGSYHSLNNSINSWFFSIKRCFFIVLQTKEIDKPCIVIIRVLIVVNLKSFIPARAVCEGLLNFTECAFHSRSQLSFWATGDLTTEEQSYKCEGVIYHWIQCEELVLYSSDCWWKENTKISSNSSDSILQSSFPKKEEKST